MAEKLVKANPHVKYDLIGRIVDTTGLTRRMPQPF